MYYGVGTGKTFIMINVAELIYFQNKELHELRLKNEEANTVITPIPAGDIQKAELGDAPHIRGYLQSASESDPLYHLKGWFNEDGSIRIELVK